VAGTSFAALFVRWALPAPPVVTGFYRMLIASALLGAWVLLARPRLEAERSGILLALASGLCFGTDIALWHTSIVHTRVATATLLVNTTPVMIGLYSWLVLRQRLDRRTLAGAALALGGTLLLTGVPQPGGDATRGALLALGAAVFYSAYLLLMSAARRGIATLPALLCMSLSSTFALGIYAALLGDPFSGFEISSWEAMIGAALVSQLGGVMAVIWALRYLPTTLASVALLGQPVGTSILGWALLGEAIGAVQAAGGIAVLIGIALAFQSRARAPQGAPARLR
jgi:drug/metabolite transporter (DMT)-like permease